MSEDFKGRLLADGKTPALPVNTSFEGMSVYLGTDKQIRLGTCPMGLHVTLIHGAEVDSKILSRHEDFEKLFALFQSLP